MLFRIHNFTQFVYFLADFLDGLADFFGYPAGSLHELASQQAHVLDLPLQTLNCLNF